MCVAVYADLISSMTLHLMHNTANGDIRVINALSRKLDIEPNRWMTRKQFISAIVWGLMLSGEGNQVTYPRFTADGLLDDLELLDPLKVSFEESGRGYRIRYGNEYLSPDEVLHFAINPDPQKPWLGTGYRAVLRDVVSGLKQASVTKQSLLKSPVPSLVVKVDGLTDDFNTAEGRTRLTEQYASSIEAGKPWMIPAELIDVKEIKPLTLNDLALAKNIELDKRTTAGIFRIPPFLVGVGSYSKDEFNNFVNTSIMPMAQVLQQEFTRKLLYSPDLYWRFNPRSLFAYDISEIVTAGGAMVDRAAMTRNEWRDWIGMSPREDMEEIVLLENYLPIERLGDQKKLENGGDDN